MLSLFASLFFMYVQCHTTLMLVLGSLFPLILGCPRESIPFVFLFNNIIVLLVCSREYVPFTCICMYICTTDLQLVL